MEVYCILLTLGKILCSDHRKITMLKWTSIGREALFARYIDDWRRFGWIACLFVFSHTHINQLRIVSLLFRFDVIPTVVWHTKIFFSVERKCCSCISNHYTYSLLCRVWRHSLVIIIFNFCLAFVAHFRRFCMFVYNDDWARIINNCKSIFIGMCPGSLVAID